MASEGARKSAQARAEAGGPQIGERGHAIFANGLAAAVWTVLAVVFVLPVVGVPLDEAARNDAWDSVKAVAIPVVAVLAWRRVWQAVRQPAAAAGRS